MKVVIINGKGESGKDTVVDISEIYSQLTVYNFSSVDIVKRAGHLLGWGNEKTAKDRKFLADLKKLSIEYNDQPTNYLLYAIKNTEEESLVFCHIREPSEIKKLKNKILEEDLNIEVTTVLVKRDDQIFGNDADDLSEQYDYDFTILNDNDIYDLRLRVLDFLKNINVPT